MGLHVVAEDLQTRGAVGGVFVLQVHGRDRFGAHVQRLEGAPSCPVNGPRLDELATCQRDPTVGQPEHCLAGLSVGHAREAALVNVFGVAPPGTEPADDDLVHVGRL